MSAPTAVNDPLIRVRESLERRISSLGERIGDHLASHLGRPGKMLRARFSLLLGAALDAPAEVRESVACAAELVHGASLLHDDCVDRASVRRGAATPNGLFGQSTGILLGDLAFVEGMAQASGLGPAAATSLLGAVREMAVGELQEEFLRGSLKLSVEGYYGLAVRKTGALFEWCARALSEGSPRAHPRSVPVRLGREAGILLQVVDDVHDFTLDLETAGKDPGQDFANGRLTLPGILALDDERTRARFIELWSREPRGGEDFSRLKALLEEGGHLEGARQAGRGLLVGMLALADRLPLREEAVEFKAFLESMARRGF